MRTGGVRDIFIHSPWQPEKSLSLGFPEHCWGAGLPNTSHDSREPVASPWGFNADSTEASYENVPKPDVVYRARAWADSMAVWLSATIVNRTDEPITDIRSLVCLKPDSHKGAPKRPDAIAGFRDTSFSRTWIFVDGRPVRLGEETTYNGDIPDRGWAEHEIRSKINWGVNIKGGPDNRTIRDVGWFRGNSPGRIVEELAEPPLIAVRDEFHEDRWLATIWQPARVLFSNPQNPCFHSDPSFPDCPARDSVTVRGAVFFHQGSLKGLLARVENWRASVPE
ncbi:MAG: hypothetical protein FVQ81_02660 [Candidatus Glassbacteria bacterium]|nr:hypothetical protein [Candidatus Glassbacteria bacterium]